MKPGLKYFDDNGDQISLWTSTHMNITQNPLATFSHAGAYSIDQSYSGSIKQYAPVDLICVKNNGARGGGGTFYHTVNPVITPSGKKHFTLLLRHDDNGGTWEVGKTYPQGTHIYTEGTAGYVTGRHVHIDVAEGHVTTEYQNSHEVWCITNQVLPDSIFFIDHTVIVNDNTDYGQRMIWQEHGGGSGVEPTPKDEKKITLVFGHMVKEMEVVKVGDIYKVVKKTKDTLELELIKDTKPTKEYVIIDKNVTTYTVHPIGQKPTDFNVKAKLKPSKFGGLEYQVLGKPYANTVTIQTRDYGKVNLPLTKHTRIIKK